MKKITLEHSGAGNFIVEAVDRKGGTDLLVNEIGEYSGGARVPAGYEVLERASGRGVEFLDHLEPAKLFLGGATDHLFLIREYEARGV